MVGLGQHQLHAKFEVNSFSRCINIKGEPQNFGEFLQLRAIRCGLTVGIGKPKLCTKFEGPSFSHCVNIELGYFGAKY